jgi:hypothetical protein
LTGRELKKIVEINGELKAGAISNAKKEHGKI